MNEKANFLYGFAEFPSRQMPDQGREPWAPVDSGSSANSRIHNGRRLKRAAVLSIERTSMGFQPKGVKNSGPSAGPNLRVAPAWLSGPPMFC
jgi:hypothetical protein